LAPGGSVGLRTRLPIAGRRLCRDRMREEGDHTRDRWRPQDSEGLPSRNDHSAGVQEDVHWAPLRRSRVPPRLVRQAGRELLLVVRQLGR